MVRAKWAGAVAAGFLGVGLALGQSHDASAATLNASTVMTFREPGKADRKCKVVKTWRDERGRQAYEIQMLDTGEHQVIFDAQPGRPTPAMASSATPAPMQGTDPGMQMSNMEPPPAPEIPRSALGTPAGITQSRVPADGWKEHQDISGNMASTAPPIPPRSNYAVTPASMASRTPAGAPVPADWRQSWGQARDNGSTAASESTLSSCQTDCCTECVQPQNEITRGNGLMRKLRSSLRRGEASRDESASNLPCGLPASEPNAFSQPAAKVVMRIPGRQQDMNAWSADQQMQDPSMQQAAMAQAMHGGMGMPPADLMYNAQPLMGATVAVTNAQAASMMNVNPRDCLQLINVLQNAGYPSQREWAAETLASQWTASPTIIPALAAAARQDPAPAVRDACVNCLAKIQASAAPATAALRTLRNGDTASAPDTQTQPVSIQPTSSREDQSR